MIDLITGHQGLPHISAKQISDINNAMMEGYGADKVMRMKDGTITLSNDTFTVNPGYWRVNGYDMEIQETESITIERTTGNLKRYDDIYVEILRDIPSGAERAELVKVEGTPASSSPSHPAAPTEPELTTDTMLLCIPVGYVYATSTYTTKHDDTIPYHYVSETEYTELLTHLFQEQYSRARMSSGNFAPIRVDDIIKLNTKGTWTHTDPAHPGAYANDTYTLDSGNIVFQISSNELGLHSILVTTSSTSGYTEKLILFKGEVGIGTDNLWLPRNGSQVRSGFSAAAIVNGEEYSVGTGGFYVELPSGVLTELYIQATSGISENISFYPTIRYKDDPTYTSSYPPAPTNIMLWNEINDEVSTRAKLGAHNLLNPIYLQAYSSSSLTITKRKNGSLTIAGTGDGDFWAVALNVVLPDGDYIVSVGLNLTLRFIGFNGSSWVEIGRTTNTLEFTASSTYYYYAIQVKLETGTTYNTTIYPQIRLASDSYIGFEPYSPTNYEVLSQYENGILGAKNLLPNFATSKTENGVTFTVNSDGSVTVSTGSGGATGNVSLMICDTNKGYNFTDVILNGCPPGGSNNTFYISIHQYGAWMVGSTGPEVRSGGTIKGVAISIRSGAVLTTPITFYPMLRLNTDTDPTYRPYAKTNKELTNDTELLKSKLIAPIQLTDLNSLPTDMGANNFSINFYNSSASNRPSDHSGIVFTFRSSSTYATQFAVANLENKIYVRYKDANNIAAPYWSSWNAIG